MLSEKNNILSNHGGPIPPPLMKPLGTSQRTIVSRGLSEALNLSPMMPRDAPSLSDSGCSFFFHRGTTPSKQLN